MEPRTDCYWYVDENEQGEYVRTAGQSGFCLVKELFTKCSEMCPDYMADPLPEKEDA